MPVVSIRMDEELHRKLRLRAYGANLSLSKFLQPVLDEAATPGSKYPFSSNDEILAIAIQIFALLSEAALHLSPDLPHKAIGRARVLLAERGLLGENDR
ncbi:CopG family transcriptional regulator [Sphingomonas sp. MG17]|uniref:CopG family transcriptional regulator n=1 Tax=Sphingomonas tagetis TaxID=2949092 RepID=A0A9X2HRJ3_9SPHN|nr:CopG family transcriptional regulator [Sphingomonas tagetis]MCP3731285.1 CopG family transcriptional regulator [Sphingomonas tagetis]